MSEAAKTWNAAVEDPSKLVAEIDNLRRELFMAKRERDSLESKLDAAPHWVPVAEFVDDMKPHIVWSKKEKACEAIYSARSSGWVICYTESSICDVTHVLVGLNPPVSNEDPRGDGDVEPVIADTKVALTTEQMAAAFGKMIEVTKTAEEDAIRERLMQPFFGSEAVKLGAMDYKLRDGERWEWKHIVRGWVDCCSPIWSGNLQYRLMDCGDVVS